MKAQDIIDRAGVQLQDQGHVRWPVDELLRYMDDAQQQVVQVSPAALSVTEPVALVAGSRQSIPAGGLRMLALHRNMGNSGNQPGRAIVMTSRAAMDAMDVEWHTETGSEVHLWTYSPDQDRQTFHVYPAPTQSLHVEATYSRLPSPVESAGQDLDLSDHYINPVLDWVLYRAYSKDADYGGNTMRAQQHLQAFAVALGEKAQSLAVTNPNLKRRGGEAGGQI